MPSNADAALVRRLGTRRLKVLRARALSSAARYRRNGYFRGALGNQTRRILSALNLTPARSAE